jgi:hypothetical protein
MNWRCRPLRGEESEMRRMFRRCRTGERNELEMQTIMRKRRVRDGTNTILWKPNNGRRSFDIIIYLLI